MYFYQIIDFEDSIMLSHEESISNNELFSMCREAPRLFLYIGDINNPHITDTVYSVSAYLVKNKGFNYIQTTGTVSIMDLYPDDYYE